MGEGVGRKKVSGWVRGGVWECPHSAIAPLGNCLFPVLFSLSNNNIRSITLTMLCWFSHIHSQPFIVYASRRTYSYMTYDNLGRAKYSEL